MCYFLFHRAAMSFDLLQAGFTDILNIEYSSVVIEIMRAKYIDTAMRFEMVHGIKYRIVFYAAR
jgi:hypothetical protein